MYIGHVERTRSQRIPKQITTVTTEGRRKGERPRKRWRDEVEDDLTIMGMYVITRQAVYYNVTLRCVRATIVAGEKK
jgi:hypothetical protein